VPVTNKNIFALERESDGISPLERWSCGDYFFKTSPIRLRLCLPKRAAPFLNFRVGFLFWRLRGLLIEHSGKVLRHRGLEEHAHQLTNADVADVCLERQFSYFFI
jgi:hypothetical protein